MRKLSVLAVLAVAIGALAAEALGSPKARRGHPAPLVFLLGHPSVEQHQDSEHAYRSQAFEFTSTRTGKAELLYLYVDQGNLASQARVGLYSNAGDRPGLLLATGSTSRPAVGWNRIALTSTRIYSGRRYWIAVLGIGGKLAYRDRPVGGCRAPESAQKDLVRFPDRWSSGPTWALCMLSAYVTGPPGSAAKPVRPKPKKLTGTKHPTSPPTPSPPPPPPPPGPSPNHTNCIVKPSACGYPDTSNTGVPAGTPLTRSGSIVISSPGTYAGLDIHGTVYVSADNVTIKDSRITASGPSGFAIHIDSNARGTVIEDSTIGGEDAGSNSVEYAVQNGGHQTQGLRLQMSNCSECWAGTGLLKDSYALVNVNIDGAHYEDIYYGGGSDPLTATHNTLLNPHNQTAVVFGGTDFGPQQNLTIADNLLAGGGYMIYAGSNDPGTQNVRITGNRLSRVYFSQGGYFGVLTYVNWSVTTWQGNFWDDTLQPSNG